MLLSLFVISTPVLPVPVDLNSHMYPLWDKLQSIVFLSVMWQYFSITKSNIDMLNGGSLSLLHSTRRAKDSSFLTDTPRSRINSLWFHKVMFFNCPGNLTLDAYEEDCEFADPAGSFRGLRRFKRNCTNFGSLLEKSNMKLMKWEDFEVSLYSKKYFVALHDKLTAKPASALLRRHLQLANCIAWFILHCSIPISQCQVTC